MAKSLPSKPGRYDDYPSKGLTVMVNKFGDRYWYKGNPSDGVFHRTDGPAKEYVKARKMADEYWKDGKKMNREEHTPIHSSHEPYSDLIIECMKISEGE